MLFDNHQRQQKNSESRELRAGDRDHVLILNASLTWTDKRFVLVLYRNRIEPWPPNRGTYQTVTSVYRATPSVYRSFNPIII